MNDETKARIEDALKQTQSQTEEAAEQLGHFLRAGAKKLREAADQARAAIQRDLDSRS